MSSLGRMGSPKEWLFFILAKALGSAIHTYAQRRFFCVNENTEEPSLYALMLALYVVNCLRVCPL